MARNTIRIPRPAAVVNLPELDPEEFEVRRVERNARGGHGVADDQHGDHGQHDHGHRPVIAPPRSSTDRPSITFERAVIVLLLIVGLIGFSYWLDHRGPSVPTITQADVAKAAEEAAKKASAETEKRIKEELAKRAPATAPTPVPSVAEWRTTQQHRPVPASVMAQPPQQLRVGNETLEVYGSNVQLTKIQIAEAAVRTCSTRKVWAEDTNHKIPGAQVSYHIVCVERKP